MSKSLVFITGATGFIGSHVVASTLQAGYRVRLSVRKAEQEPLVRSRYPEYNDDIEVVVLPDLSKPEAFSEALHDVDYIFHLASPMPGRGEDIHRDYVDPAVNATLSILHAAQAFKQIKKVIIVSSVLALTPADAVIAQDVSAKDNTGLPNPVDLDAAFPEGFAGHALKYSASKIKAHEATRDFLVNNTPHYNLITFHPVFVLGDSMIQQGVEDPSGMNGLFWMSMFSEKPQMANAWVHVLDVADAHVKALETDIETGKEFILSRPVVSWDEAAAYVNEKYPALGCKLQGPFQGGWTVDTTAADQTFGLKWRSESAIIDDVVKQQLGFRAQASSL
ncbi:dihydroflavonal-4-reductase [Penicillium herquei]|nr:dihydroflavonal-4-reductase [Penicillium herquei]